MSEQHPNSAGIASQEKPHQIEGLELLSEVQAPTANFSYYGSFYKERPEAEFVTATTLEADGSSEELVLRVLTERGTHNDLLFHLLIEDKELSGEESPRMFVTAYDSKGESGHLFFETTPDDSMKAFKSPYTFAPKRALAS